MFEGPSKVLLMTAELMSMEQRFILVTLVSVDNAPFFKNENVYFE